MYEYDTIKKTSSSKKNPIIQRQISDIINKAGVELEMGGVRVISKSTGDRFEKHHLICDDPHIETDTTNLEYVGKETDDIHTLLRETQRGSEKLWEFQREVHFFDGIEDRDYIMEDVASRQYLARPQITFEIQKDRLFEFSQRFDNNDITYSNRQSPTTNQPTSGECSRIDDTVWLHLDETLHKLGLAGATVSPSSAKGLARITIMMLYFASMRQDEKKIYYKSRFSLLPRTSLKDSCKQLSADSQGEYQAIMNAFLAGEGNTLVKSYESHANPDDPNVASANFSDIIHSIYQDYENSIKTMTGSNGQTQQKKVDLLSSDVIASTFEIGASVGALELPAEASGIFEVRSMPFISIEEPQNAVAVVQDAVNAYK